MDELPPLVFIHKNSQDGSRWVAHHNNIIFYLYMSNPITLLKYYQKFEKKTYIECIDLYDALAKIYACTKRQPLFKSDVEPKNYLKC